MVSVVQRVIGIIMSCTVNREYFVSKIFHAIILCCLQASFLSFSISIYVFPLIFSVFCMHFHYFSVFYKGLHQVLYCTVSVMCKTAGAMAVNSRIFVIQPYWLM